MEEINGISISSSDNPEVFVWKIEGLWESSRDLPVEQTPVADLLSHLQKPQADWYDGDAPTALDFLHHARRINDADLSFPIILSAEGCLMDGRHRLAKAALLGHEYIATVRFPQNPEPDWRKPKE